MLERRKSRRGSDFSASDEPVDLNSFATKKTASAGAWGRQEIKWEK